MHSNSKYAPAFLMMVAFASVPGFTQTTYPHPNSPELLERLRRQCPEISETYIQQIDEEGVIEDIAPAAAFSICQYTTGNNHYKFFRLNPREISCYQLFSIKRGYQACWDKFLTAYRALGKSPAIGEINATLEKWRTEACYKDFKEFRYYLSLRVIARDGFHGEYDECFDKFGDKNPDPDYWRTRDAGASTPPSINSSSSDTINPNSTTNTQPPQSIPAINDHRSTIGNDESGKDSHTAKPDKSKRRERKGGTLEINP